jgi:hypothetical protein
MENTNTDMEKALNQETAEPVVDADKKSQGSDEDKLKGEKNTNYGATDNGPVTSTPDEAPKAVVKQPAMAIPSWGEWFYLKLLCCKEDKLVLTEGEAKYYEFMVLKHGQPLSLVDNQVDLDNFYETIKKTL